MDVVFSKQFYSRETLEAGMIQTVLMVMQYSLSR